MKSEERVALWDNLKFLMITLMVIGHFADVFTGSSATCRSIYLFIYAFHMPLLIFISGLFFKDERITEKTIYYLSCCYALKIVLTLCGRAFSSTAPEFSLLSGSFAPWFMFVLAVYTMAMHFLKRVNSWYILAAVLILACFAGYDKTLGDYLALSRSIVFFPFYLLGTMVSQEDLLRLRKRYAGILIPVALIVLLLWFYMCFGKLSVFYKFRHLFTGRNPFSNAVIAYGPLARLFCYAVTFLTGTSLIVLVPQERIMGWTNMGSRTINVYFWHWPVYLVLNHFFSIKSIFSAGRLGKAGFLLTAVLLSILLASVKLFDFPLKQIRTACFKSNPARR